jgi:hypothetical protein
MSWVIEEITTSTIGFIIAMVVLSVIIGVGLYGYWIYANHVTLENYLWPIAEVLPWKGEYFLAIVNTGNEPFYVKQIYLKGGTVLTPNQATNPNLNWCSVANTKLVHNQWWCGMVNQLPVAVRICSTLDPSVCVVAPVHGWVTVTFSQPSQAAFGISNCPVLASVSDPYSAGWQVTWTMTGSTYSVSESTSYQWCILPPYYPITIDFQSTITQSPSGYQCQISPQLTQVNYNGTPTTVPFTVTCQQQQQPPPPPPPPPSPSPPGGNNGGSAVVDTVIDAPSSVSWTVNLYFNSQLEQTYQGSGSQSYTWDAPYGASGEVSYQASAPNTCTVSYSPSQSFTISPGNTYTETITITCQGQPTPPPPPMCYFSYSAATVPPGLNANLQFTGPSGLNPGQSGGLSGSAPKYATDSQGDRYEFEKWVIGSNPNGYADAIIYANDFGNGWIPSCPSNLTSSVNVQVLGHAEYQFIGCVSYSVNVTLSSSGAGEVLWDWCPGDPAVSWSVNAYGQGENIYAQGTVNAELSGSHSSGYQWATVCGTGQTVNYEGVSPSGGSINPPQASGSESFQVQFTCQSTGGGGGGRGPG